jgi:glycine betaine catabolism B
MKNKRPIPAGLRNMSFRAMQIIDNIIDKITMYRLVLYVLIVLIGIAIILSYIGLLSYSPLAIVTSTLFLIMMCWAANTLFAKTYKASTNIESVYITALILALIINPAKSPHDLIFLGWAALLAMASKFIIAINKKHIFNPVAIAVVLTAFGIGQSASWWVGNTLLMPFVLIGGYLVVRKIRREDLIYCFIITVLILILGLAILNANNIVTTLNQIFFHSSLFFFAFIMLTEPLTTPSKKNMQILYGVLTGILFIPQLHIASLYSTPELALVIGNIFSYLVSPKQKLLLYLQQKIKTGDSLMDFIFIPQNKFNYTPGQYMEWTLSHPHPDSRGNRRYFTLSSSPTEKNIRLGVKFYDQSSTFKNALANLDYNTPLIAAQLAGDFTLPNDAKQKLVFIAGGIGITPFRSMIKYLIDIKQERDIVLLYSNKNADEVMYSDVFNQAQRELGIKTVYTITDSTIISDQWKGRVGRINTQVIKEEVADYKERIFYLSGPHAMVLGFEQVLKELGVKKEQIKKDYFPGFV